MSLWLTPSVSKASTTLGRQLPGWLQDQGPGHARAGAATFEFGQHRQGEGSGFSGARLGDAEDIAPLHRHGDGFSLNWCRSIEAGMLYAGKDFRAKAEVGKFH